MSTLTSVSSGTISRKFWTDPIDSKFPSRIRGGFVFFVFDFVFLVQAHSAGGKKYARSVEEASVPCINNIPVCFFSSCCAAEEKA